MLGLRGQGREGRLWSQAHLVQLPADTSPCDVCLGQPRGIRLGFTSFLGWENDTDLPQGWWEKQNICKEQLVEKLAGEALCGMVVIFIRLKHFYAYSHLMQTFENISCVPSPVLDAADTKINKYSFNK